MAPVIWWIITAVVFFTLELAAASFFFLWIGAGALLTAAVSYFVDTAWVQYATFGAASVLLVVLSRPWASRFSGASKRAANVDALVGRTAVVTKVEKHSPHQGYVKVDGEVWKAESEQVLALHGEVTVLSVRGNKLEVRG